MITVVVPTCRRPDLLARCLDRLAPGAQHLPADQYEVIVTDDGVPTVEHLVAERYPWARWTNGPRRGPAANRNHGAGLARGEWLAFTDDDCLPEPGWLAAFAAAVRPGVEVYEGRTTCREGLHSPLDHAPGNETGGYLWSCNMMVAADLFRRLGGFDERFPYPHLEDVDFRERLTAAGVRYPFVPDAVVDHPPRRLPGGWRLGLSHESMVYYNRKYGRPARLGSLAVTIISTRWGRLRSHHSAPDMIRATAALAAELTAVGLHWPVWLLRYRSVDPYRLAEAK